MRRLQQQRGMTLLEIMVAIAILGVTLSAMLFNISQQINNLSYLEEKTVANWVAQNKFIEMELDGKWPKSGKKTSEAKMFGKEWYLKVIPEKTEMNFYLLKIEVRKNEKDELPLSIFTGFMVEQ